MKQDAQQQGVIAPPAVELTPTEPITRRGMRRRLGIRRDLPLKQQVWLLAKWPLLEQLMAFLVGFVDVALSGRLPDDPATPLHEAIVSTNAIAIASYLTWLMGLLQGSIGIGALALIARAVGARHRREASAAVGQSMGIALIWGTVIGALFFVIAEPLGRVFNLSGQTLSLYTTYMRLLAVAVPFMALMFIGSACLRGAGDFRTPFWVMVLVNLVNIVVSVALVAAPAPFGGYGLAGIAIGTVAAWIVGGVLMTWWLMSGRGGLRLHLHRLKPHKRMATRIIRISLPSLAENFLHWAAGGAFVAYVVGRLVNEPNALGAHIIAIRVEALSFLPGVAFSQAASTMVGQYLGSHEADMARKAAWTCWRFAAAFMGVLGLLFIVAPQAFIWMMTDERQFIEPASAVLRIAGFAQLGFSTALVLSGAMRGAGDTRNTMLLTIVSMYGVRVPLVWLIGIVLELGLIWIWVALSFELVFRGVLFLLRFLHGGWARAKV